MSSSRHQARIAAMQTLFAYEFHGGDMTDVLKNTMKEKAEDLEKEEQYIAGTVKGILEHRADIIEKIKEFAVDWPLEKIAPVDRAILEVGTYEILYSADVPPIVAINEAIEIAKNFGDMNAPKFVNGVLSAILKKYCTHRDHKTGKAAASNLKTNN